MQGNQSKGLFMWKGGDPSTRKILEGSSLKCHPFLSRTPLPLSGGKVRESLLEGGAKRWMTFQPKKVDHSSAIYFRYSVYTQRVVLVPSTRIFLLFFAFDTRHL